MFRMGSVRRFGSATVLFRASLQCGLRGAGRDLESESEEAEVSQMQSRARSVSSSSCYTALCNVYLHQLRSTDFVEQWLETHSLTAQTKQLLCERDSNCLSLCTIAPLVCTHLDLDF